MSEAPAPMGKYTLLARLGDGGMADVFLAVARGPAGFNKLAVIKRLRNTEDDSFVQMFLDEARLSARLSHPNIVQTYEVGDTQGKFFMALEYLEGQSLHALLTWLARRSEGLGEVVAAFVVEQVLRGLHYAHELADYNGTALGIVHRDVSPHNVFITYRGEVKLLDFGIAKATLNMTHTETGVLKGKIRYMAPEQVAEKSFDRRVDVFAMGIVLWEMLARRRLFEGDSISVLNKIMRDDAPTVRSERPEISPELEAIVVKALRRDPRERYATADEMRIDLDRFLRKKRDAETDTALARILVEAFGMTRETVRARINTFLAMVPSAAADSPSGSSLARPADDLPALLGDGGSVSGSGPRASPGTSNPSLTFLPPTEQTPHVAPVARPRWIRLAGVAALIVAAAIAGVVLRSRGAPAAPIASPAAPAAAHVQISTTPPGALVEWSGKSLGATPVGFALPAGKHTLMLSLDGYESEAIVLDVTPGASIDRALALRSKSIVPAGTIEAPSPAAATPTPAGHAVTPPPKATRPASPAPSASAPRPKIRVLDDEDAK